MRTFIQDRQKMSGLFLPSDAKTFDRSKMIWFLQNVEEEIREELFSMEEIDLINTALFGRFLDEKTRPFFLYHFIPIWLRAISYLFKDNSNPRIIELGCGTGTSSLLFASLGGEVIGIDLDKSMIHICEKRKKFF